MAEKMAVYRVEHQKTGQGPYRDRTESAAKSALRIAHAYASGDYPAWSEDEIPPLGHYAAGFDSLPKLMKWFNGHMDVLVESGYVIRVFWVKRSSVRIGISGKQLAFPRWPSLDIPRFSYRF